MADFLQGLAHAFGTGDRLPEVTAGEQDPELLATQASKSIFRAEETNTQTADVL